MTTIANGIGFGSSRLRRAAALALLLLSATARGEWAWQSPLPTGEDLFGVAWNGTRVVAVGAGGAILTSRDGLSWTGQESGGLEGLYAVTWAQSQFVAVGQCTSCTDPMSGIAYTSPDGLAWTRRDPGPARALFGVHWTGTQLVAVGDAGTILTSPDGVRWTARASGVGSHLEGVGSTGTQVVVTGADGTILTSPDGVTWTRREGPDRTALLRGVLATPGLLVVVGEQMASHRTRGVVWTSADGITWTSRAEHEASQPLHSLVRHGGLFVAVGESTTQAFYRGPAIILTSPDAVTWTRQESHVVFILAHVVSLGSRLVAVGWSGNLVTSEDGVTWTSRRNGPGTSYFALVDAGDRIVLAGERGTVATSTDGLRWTPRATGTEEDLRGLAFTGTRLVAVGHNGAIVTSTDGVSWTVRDSGTTATLRSVVFTPTGLVTVGDDGTVLSSADGDIWTAQAAPTTATLTGVAFTGSRLVAVGTGESAGVIMTSEPGQGWVDRTPASTPYLTGIAAGSAGIVAVGGGEGGPAGMQGAVMTSADGVTWSAPLWISRSHLNGAGAAGADLFAVGDSGTILTSRNGSAWREEPFASGMSLFAAGAPREQLLVAGQDGAILARIPEARWRVWIPAAAHAAGANGSLWVTDVVLLAVGDGPVPVTVRFRSGESVLSRDFTLSGGEEVVLEDVAALLGGGGSGPVEVTAGRPLRLASRTYTRTPSGEGCPEGATFGEALAGVAPVSGLSAGQSAWLLGLEEDDAFRTNLSFANLGASDALATVTLFDGAGSELGQRDVVVGPGGLVQLVRPLVTSGRASIPNAFARVTVISGSGVVPFAAVIDNRTNDPIAVTMTRGASAGTNLWVPAAVHAEGSGGSLWQSDLALLVPGSAPATIDVRFQGPAGVESYPLVVGAGQQIFLRDVVAALPATGSGSLRLVSDQPVLAGSRVYDRRPDGSACAPSGTSGEWSPAVATADGLSAGETGHLVGLREGEGFRTNVSLTNAGDVDARVEVDLLGSDGRSLGTLPVELASGVYLQLVRPFAGRAGAASAYASVRVVAGEGILASASVIDERSSSPTVQPALR